jgi:hypothetical protein
MVMQDTEDEAEIRIQAEIRAEAISLTRQTAWPIALNLPAP